MEANAIVEWDRDLCVKRWSARAEHMFGWQESEVVGKYWRDWQFVCSEDMEDVMGITARLLNGTELHNISHNHNYTKDGSMIDCEWYNSVLRDESGNLISILSLVQDVSKRPAALGEHQLAGSKLRIKARQQAGIAELSQYALAQKNLAPLLERAVNLVADLLEVEYCQVWELLPDGKNLLLKAGVGWQDELVGGTTVSADTNSQPGYILLSSEPVVVTDLLSETRFNVPALLLERQIVSSMDVVIQGRARPFGVLGTHTTRQRIFSQDDINFIQAIANILAQVVERHQVERSLRASEERYRSMYDNSPVMQHSIDSQDKLISVSNYWLEKLGYKREEVLERKSTEFLTEKSQQYATEIVLPQFFQQGFCQDIPYQFVKKNGQIIDVLLSAIAEKDFAGNVIRSLAVLIDVSKQKQAEQKISEQAALLDIATDAIIVRGIDNQILFWNRGAEKLYGWTQAEVLERDANEFLNRESLTELDEIQQVVRERGEWQGELHQVTKASTAIVVQSRWTLVKDEAENPRSFLVVNTDITEQKQLAAQFLRTQRLESLGTLAGGIAHDLNNILAPILGFSQLLLLKLPNLDEQTQEYFKIIKTNAQRGSALVKQILTFAQSLEGDRGTVQIGYLIDEIEQIIQETFPKTITLEINTPKNLWTVNGDVNQIHQVLMNLAVNARDAMPEGGKLTIKAENFMVNANYARLYLDAQQGSYVLITVADTGEGIPPDIIDRIFEPFFTTKEIGRGTGLGLSTAIGIVKSHGGFVDVVSDIRPETRGTQVKVFFPASETAVIATEETEELPQGNGELILVVDDETPILEVTKATLETYNYRVLTASDGIEAIAAYARQPQEISVVLIDLMMPEMTGLTAMRTLRKINPSVKLIAISGLAERDKIIAAERIGIKAFLAKPYTAEELLLNLKEVIVTN